MPGAADRTVRKHALAVEARARTTAPRRDGLLANAHETRPAGTLAYLVVNTAAYAAAVHDGSRPHIITPRNARALRFWPAARRSSRGRSTTPARRASPGSEALDAERDAFARDIRDLAEGR
jgi:hypothetical protein